MSTVEASYCEYVGQALQTQQRELSRRWLERLVALLPVDANAVFTSNELLDHIPRLIDQIGKYVSAPDMADIAANTLVTEHARELGQLRHRQQASVYQVLREYDLLAELLEQFLDERTDAMATAPAAKECLEASRRVGRAVRVLMQTTVATFISEYTDTITAQATRIDQFNRAVSHELRNVLGTLQFSGALLKNGSPPDPTTQERILATLSRNTDRALQIVRSLERLPRSGILAGDTPTEQFIDLSELISEVIRQLEGMAEAHGVALQRAVSLESTSIPVASSSSSSTWSPTRSSTAIHRSRTASYSWLLVHTKMVTRSECATTESGFPPRPSRASSSVSTARTRTWTRLSVLMVPGSASRSSKSA
jgi:signal transduction histidine kinase